MNEPKEQDIQRQILDYLRFKQICCWKQNNGGIKKPDGSYIPSQSVGVPDILGCLPGGRMLAIEVKRKGNKPSPAQAQFIERLQDNGALAFVAYSVDDVVAKLEPNRRITADPNVKYKLAA